ncbi:MAG: CoA pyrophosphatase [Patulibacter sp.]
MTRPSATVLADLIARGPAAYARQIWQPLAGDRPASVLIPLVADDTALRVVLTRRSPTLAKHAGEFSFPGGRPEPHDADLLATALREAQEEIGLPASRVDVIGSLPPTTTYRTGFAITPYVGLVDRPSSWVTQASEVAEVAEPQLIELVAARQVQRYRRADGTTLDLPVFPLDGERQVWGATARMLDELLARLAPIIPGGGPR